MGPAAQAAPKPLPQAPTPPPPATADQGFAFSWPANGQVIGAFDEVKNKGLDIAGQAGDPILAAADGQVVYAGAGLRGYGNLIILDHGDGHHTYYAHLSAFAQDIRPGTLVRRGEEIGQVGSTGFSTGPHLHFEIRKQGQYIDPANKQSQLRFWQLAEQEQSQAVSRLMRLQITPGAAPVVVEASRGPRPD
jgi:lipoprotein NlpD